MKHSGGLAERPAPVFVDQLLSGMNWEPPSGAGRIFFGILGKEIGLRERLS